MKRKLDAVTCVATLVCGIVTAAGAWGQEACKGPTTSASIVDFTESMPPARRGFLSPFRDDKCGKLYLEIPSTGGPDLLYQAYLASGVGQRDLEIDRGARNYARLVSFRRFGAKVLLIERNTRYFAPDSMLGAVGDAGSAFANSTV